jgi:hypothetical protein
MIKNNFQIWVNGLKCETDKCKNAQLYGEPAR